MTLYYILVFVIGIICGAVSLRLPISKHRRQPVKHSVDSQLDTVDEMVLWGEVTNDPFYKGY
jgi:hypothetical protein